MGHLGIFAVSKKIDDFGIIAPISSKVEYPNYILEKGYEFDSTKPFVSSGAADKWR